jgi:hypothetical protein
MKKQVRYNGPALTLSTCNIYDVVEESDREYKIRDDFGKLSWYVKTNFVEVKDKVSTPTNNTISPDLVSKIEMELKATEERMADLRKQLVDAKKPPTDNILLRATRKDPNWMNGSVFDVFDGFVGALSIAAKFPKGLAMSINSSGDGIELDNDYRWELTEDDEGRTILMVFDKE